jgi:hypothetical protein
MHRWWRHGCRFVHIPRSKSHSTALWARYTYIPIPTHAFNLSIEKSKAIHIPIPTQDRQYSRSQIKWLLQMQWQARLARASTQPGTPCSRPSLALRKLPDVRPAGQAYFAAVIPGFPTGTTAQHLRGRCSPHLTYGLRRVICCHSDTTRATESSHHIISSLTLHQDNMHCTKQQHQAWVLREMLCM